MLGKFIVFEGGEGAGKTTQLVKLQQWLATSGWQERIQSQITSSPAVVVTREPGGTLLGKRIRKLLLDVSATAEEQIDERAELLLFAADRAQHVANFLRPHLQQGALVLCDRYTDSTLAYQGYGRGLDLSLIHQLNQIATQGLASDLTFWLDIEPEKGLTRTGKREPDADIEVDRMESTELAFHQRLRQGFIELAQLHCDRMIHIPAQQPEEQIAQHIQGMMERHLQQWYP